MIKLLRVAAENFRSLGSVTIEPALDPGSMTAFTGPNGSGKSSVVYAIAWCLYGQTPDGVTVSGIRRQGSDPSTECHVIVELEHQEQHIRVMRAVKGARNASIAVITVDGVEVSVASTKTATQWISNRLGIDYQGFLTAVLVLQKDLEGLVRLRPAERKRLVERLAGIDRMSEAANLARDHENSLKKAYVALPDVTDEISDTETHIGTLQASLNALEKAESALQQELTDAEHAAEQASDTLQQIEEALNRATQTREQLNELRNSHAATSARIDEWNTQLEAVTRTVGSNGQHPRPIDVIESDIAVVKQEQQQITHLDASLGSLSRQVAAQRGEHTTLQRALDATATNTTEAAPLDQELSTLRSVVTQLQADVEQQVEELGAKRGEYERVSAAIKALEGADSTCPTCQQNVTDRGTILRALKSTLEAVTASGSELKAEVAGNKATLETHANDIARLEQESAERVRAQRDRERLEQQLETADKELQKLLAEENDLQLAKAALPALADAQAAERDLQKELSAAQSHQQAVHTVNQLNARIQEGRNKIKETQESIAELERELERTCPDPATHAKARQDVTETTTQLSAIKGRLTEHRATLTISRSELAQQQTSLSALQGKQKERSRVAFQLAAATVTREGLTQFRDDRLARLTPELSEISTELISHMTGGKYVAVRFDEDFSAYLNTIDGDERPASWLSGGEEALVALAMRLAIGEILTGGQGGLLVLDEVLTAQDSERRTLTMSVLRDLPSRQVIMINHVAESADLADSVYEFTPNMDSGSTAHQPQPEEINPHSLTF